MDNVGLVRILLIWLQAATFSGISAHNRVRRSAVEEFTHFQSVFPKVYSGKTQLSSTQTENGHHRELSISFPVFNRNLVLDLHLNSKLFGKTYVEKYFNEEDKEVVYTASNHKKTHCYYHGHVRGVRDSVVALSTCNGLSGYIADDVDTFHIAPAHSVIDGEHYVFRDSDRIPTNFTCGHSGPDSYYKPLPSNRTSRLKRDLHWPYDTTEDTKIVELYVANDLKQYETYNRDLAKVIARTKDIVNIVSSLYRPLNIYVALVGVEVWTTRDKIVIVDNAGTTMNNFLEYRKRTISLQHKNDNAQLLTGHSFSNGVVGKAPIYTICTWQYSGGVNTDHSVLVGPVATTVAHEMGHNFGLTHDLDSCDCEEDRCIMAPSSGGIKNPTKWSSCSMDEFSDAFYQGMDHCLHNLPDVIEGPSCGNGFVEQGEDCDCGLVEDCNNPCCNASTCRLMPNTTCGGGQCCDFETCQLKPATTVCRRAKGECDLSEHCNGISQFCPYDVFMQDGTECDGGKTHCFQGGCNSRDSQCKLLWGKTGSEAHSLCYTHYNPMGIAAGNCGFNWLDKTFKPCEEKDALCGMLHCQHGSEKLMHWREALTYLMPDMPVTVDGKRFECTGAILDVGLDEVDPGLVPSGAKCGPDMMCVDQKCEHIPSLDVKACPDCHGHGYCNSLGQCHCHPGYAPPHCNKKGRGGSLHSGPTSNKGQSDNSLVVAMCVIFLVILPLLVFVIFIAYRKREKLKEMWSSLSKGKPSSTSERYRSIYRANPRNDIMKANDKPKVPPPPAATKVQATEMKRTGSFRPEDISRPSLQSSTNKTVNMALPLAHGSSNHGAQGSHPAASPPGGASNTGAGKPIPTRPAPTRPGAMALNRSPSDATAASGANRSKPGRPPPPNLQRSHSSAGAPNSPPARPPTLPVINSDSSSPPGPKYENLFGGRSAKSPQGQNFEDIPLNSPTSPSDSSHRHYANEPQEQPIRTNQSQPGGLKNRIRQFESNSKDSNGSKDTEGGTSRTGPVHRSASAPSKKPAVAPKPREVSFRSKPFNDIQDSSC